MAKKKNRPIWADPKLTEQPPKQRDVSRFKSLENWTVSNPKKGK
jgi:hypothetical protein